MLERNETRSWVGGVATAIADSTGTSVFLVRLAFMVGFFAGGIGLAVYAYLWSNIPGHDNQMHINFT